MKYNLKRFITIILTIVLIFSNQTVLAQSINNDFLETEQSVESEDANLDLDTDAENDVTIKETENELESDTITSDSELELIETVDETNENIVIETETRQEESLDEIKASPSMQTDSNSLKTVYGLGADSGSNVFYYYTMRYRIKSIYTISISEEDNNTETFDLILQTLNSRMNKFKIYDTEYNTYPVNVKNSWQVLSDEKVFYNEIELPEGFTDPYNYLQVKIPYEFYTDESYSLSLSTNELKDQSNLGVTLKSNGDYYMFFYETYLFDNKKDSKMIMEGRSSGVKDRRFILNDVYKEDSPYTFIAFLSDSSTDKDVIQIPKIKHLNVTRELVEENSNTVTYDGYQYQLNPILDNLNEYLYLKTDNPNPSQIRLVDKSTKYANETSSQAIYTQEDSEFIDVSYENISSKRVNGGYIFKSQYVNDRNYPLSDGGEFTLEIKNAAGNFIDTGQKLTIRTLVNYDDYMFDNYYNSEFSKYENLRSINDGLNTINIYPHRYVDTDKPTGRHPFLSSSPYPELGLNENTSNIYERSDKNVFLYKIYPYIWDSLSTPGYLNQAAKRIDPNASVSRGWTHADIMVSFDSQQEEGYGGAGYGGYDPVFTRNINKDFLFDGSGNDLVGTNVKNFRERLYAYKEEATAENKLYLDQLNGPLVNEIIGTGSWIKVIVEGFSNYTTLAYRYPDYQSPDKYTDVASDAWVDGRYININERLELGARFSDYPNADIILRAVSFVDENGVNQTKDLYYRYDSSTDTWKAFDVNRQIADRPEFTLTRQQVLDMVPDRNTHIAPTTGFIYDGTAKPGTPFSDSNVTGIKAPELIELTVGEYVYSSDRGISVIPEDVLYNGFMLESSDEHILEVDSGYYLRAKAKGEVTLKITSYDSLKTKTIKVRVIEKKKGWDAKDGQWTFIKDDYTYARNEWVQAPIIDSNGNQISTAWKFFDYSGFNVEKEYIGSDETMLSVVGPYKDYHVG